MDHPLCQLGGIQGVEHQTPASRELDNSLLLSDLPADVGGLSSALNLSPSASVDLTTYVGGSLVRIEFPHTVRSQVGGGRKGDLRGLSSKSRREMLNFMNSINKDRLGSPPLLATLTYADRFPTDKATWTEHFNRRFRRRLARSGARSFSGARPERTRASGPHTFTYCCSWKLSLRSSMSGSPRPGTSPADASATITCALVLGSNPFAHGRARCATWQSAKARSRS
jgi:hypothetical protein